MGAGALALRRCGKAVDTIADSVDTERIWRYSTLLRTDIGEDDCTALHCTADLEIWRKLGVGGAEGIEMICCNLHEILSAESERRRSSRARRRAEESYHVSSDIIRSTP